SRKLRLNFDNSEDTREQEASDYLCVWLGTAKQPDAENAKRQARFLAVSFASSAKSLRPLRPVFISLPRPPDKANKSQATCAFV
ncbi:MAG: hypothetical protein Q4G71_02040, partial [Pseudomonadota bacterium]|nr:hypothetical protein [Pseudomonadota bacterium]